MFLPRYWGREIILEGTFGLEITRADHACASSVAYIASHHLIIARIPVFY
jgi:hypothetical protein